MANKSTEPKAERDNYADTIGVESCSLEVARLVVQLCWYDRHVPMLISESGVGKTGMISQLAAYNKARMEMYNLGHMDRVDLTGPAFPSKTKRDAYVYLRDGRLPFLGYEDAEDFVVMFLDEFNRGKMDTINGVFSAIGERRLGMHTLGHNALLVAAMNPPNTDYAVEAKASSDPALRRRFCNIVVEPSAATFLDYASDPKAAQQRGVMNLPPLEDFPPPPHRIGQTVERPPFHPTVLDFIQSSPTSYYDHQSQAAGKVYANPAVWEAVSDTLDTVERLGLSLDILSIRAAVRVKLGGFVGKVTAATLVDAMLDRDKRPLDPWEVLRNYKPGTPIYGKIQTALQREDTAFLTSTCESVAAALHLSPKLPYPIPEFIEQLGRLHADLRDTHIAVLIDASVAFEKQRLATSAGADDPARLTDIQLQLAQTKSWAESRAKKLAIRQQAEREAQASQSA